MQSTDYFKKVWGVNRSILKKSKLDPRKVVESDINRLHNFIFECFRTILNIFYLISITNIFWQI